MNSRRLQKGSAIALVFVFAAALCITAAVLIKYAGTEFRLNQRNQLRFQAKNAAEAMLEYGASEVMYRLQKKANFATDELTATATQLATPTARKSTLFAAGSTNNVAPGDLNFWASQLTDPTTRYIDPTDAGNNYDPLREQTVRVQTVRLLASATSRNNGIAETQYATQSIEIRDVFLFNYAIFYNIQMEFHPGANMTISGPVHSNVDTFLTTDATLKFLSSYTTAGKMTIGAVAAGRPTGRNVYFNTGLDTNADGTPDTVIVNDSNIQNAAGTAALGTYVDSDVVSRATANPLAPNTFATIASQVWHGEVQDSSMGIIAQNLPAVTAGNSAQGHTMIEIPDTSGSADAAIEAQKYSNKAGLYIFQGSAVAGAAPEPVAFKTATDAAAFRALTPTQRTTYLNNSANFNKIVALPSNTIVTKRRLKDFRESSVVNLVDIDLAKLRTAVNTTTANATTNAKVWAGTSGTPTTDWNLDASTGGWNGQVYVEVENPSAGYTTTSDIVSPNSSGAAALAGSGTRTAVRLINGSQVPNRRAANGSAVEGITIATNAPVYIQGNLNSPGIGAGTRGGVAVTDDNSNIGTPKDNEVPVAIAADAINILSNAWSDNTSAATTRPDASNTEVSAAFLTGNVPTSGTGGSSYSGGVENFPRFLEDWSGGIKFRYRGSMVALFNSTVATGPWSAASYSPPTREWGFNTMFRDGRQPPGTPMLRTFRRVTYSDLTAAQFDALKTTTMFHFTAM